MENIAKLQGAKILHSESLWISLPDHRSRIIWENNTGWKLKSGFISSIWFWFLNASTILLLSCFHQNLISSTQLICYWTLTFSNRVLPLEESRFPTWVRDAGMHCPGFYASLVSLKHLKPNSSTIYLTILKHTNIPFFHILALLSHKVWWYIF